MTYFVQQSLFKTAAAEGALALFTALHCSILSCDHLGILCKKQFQESEAGKNIRMRRTKCSTVITNVLAPHFQATLKQSIVNNHLASLLMNPPILVF